MKNKERDKLSDNRRNTSQNIKMSDRDNIDNHRTSKEKKIKVRELQKDFMAIESGTLPGSFIHAINNY